MTAWALEFATSGRRHADRVLANRLRDAARPRPRDGRRPQPLWRPTSTENEQAPSVEA